MDEPTDVTWWITARMLVHVVRSQPTDEAVEEVERILRRIAAAGGPPKRPVLEIMDKLGKGDCN